MRFWRYALLLAITCCVMLRPAAGSDDTARVDGAVFVAPGQEDMLAEMLGRGATLPGDCAFTGGQIGGAIRSTYRCNESEIVLELRHPSEPTAAVLHTSRFAVVVLTGSPPRALLATLESRIRSREQAFEWTRLPPPPPTASQASAREASPPAAEAPRSLFTRWMLAAAALLAATVGVWLLQRRAAAHGRVSPLTRTWSGVRQWVNRRRRGALRLVHDPIGELRLCLRSESFWIAAIFVASTGLRGWLSFVNRESNDDHGIVAEMIRLGAWLPPASSACMECSHAKLYHYALAITFHFIGGDGRLLGNLLNFAAGTALLMVLYVFSRSLRCSPAVRVLGFAFLSFNPALVGIFSMSTNDGFCILFSSLAIFSLNRFLAARVLGHAVVATAWTVLAALSKASGWAIFAAGCTVLFIAAWAAEGRLRRAHVRAAVVFLAGFLLVVPFINPYRENFAQWYSPFVNDAFDTPVMRDEVPRAPLGWIVEAFFTFRMVELLRQPYVALHEESPSLHRESLWSQLYGRALFLRFDQGIWGNLDPGLLRLGRVSLVLGLLPLAALLLGITGALQSTFRGAAMQGRHWLARHTEWQHLVYVGVMLAALITLVVEYHRLAILFLWMKTIYLLPAVLSLFALFLYGLERLWRRYPRVVTAWIAAATASSIADLGWLIHDVTRTASP